MRAEALWANRSWRLNASLLLLLGLTLSFSQGFAAVNPQTPQPGSPGFWEVRAIEAADLGIPGPLGLAFSPAANAFLLPVPGAAGTNAEASELILMSPFADPLGSVQPAAPIPDPTSLSFDSRTNRLLFVDPGTEVLVQVSADSTGRPGPEATAVRRHSAKSLGIREAGGMAVDPESGRMYLLDAKTERILWIDPDAAGSLDAGAATAEGRLGQVNLAGLANGRLRGLAFSPQDGHLYLLLLSPTRQLLYELTQEGQVVSTRDLGSLRLRDPQAMLFAPSGDLTDDPAAMHLHIADRGQKVAPGKPPAGSGILEVSLLQTDTETGPAPQPLVAPVRIIDTSLWDPPSPDGSGIGYWAARQLLVVSDSEVEEMSIYEGKNVFLAAIDGTLMSTCKTTPFSSEPTEVSVNPYNNHFFFSDDNAKKVFEVNPGPDGDYCTADDSITSFSTTAFGNMDPEGVAFGRVNGRDKLFISDGVNREVYIVDPGPNGLFDGVPSAGGDDVTTHFDTGAIGLSDPEGIDYSPITGTLFLVSREASDDLVETTLTGSVIRRVDISFIMAPAGVALAPSIQDPALLNACVSDRGVDNNNQDPDENDGKVYEIALGIPSNITPTATTTGTPATPTASATPTRTATPTTTATPDGPPVTLTFAAEADSFVEAANPDTNHGDYHELAVDGSPVEHIYLRFVVGGLNGVVQSARLRLYALGNSADGPAVYSTSDSWTETGITWNNRPAYTGTPVADAGPITRRTWVEFELKDLVNGNGTFSFALVPTSGDGLEFSSRTGTQPPQLVVTVDAQGQGALGWGELPSTGEEVYLRAAGIDLSLDPSASAADDDPAGYGAPYPAGQAPAGTCERWVAPPPVGDDGNPGTPDLPWATLRYAARNVPDDSCTVWFAEGLYTGSHRLNRRFTTPTTFKSVVPYRAVFENAGNVVAISGGTNVILEGFEFRQSGPGGSYQVVAIDQSNQGWAENVTLRNNIIHDSYGDDLLKIYNGARFVTVEGNVFYNQGTHEEHMDVNSVTDVVIQDNIFFNDPAGSGRSDYDTKQYIVIKDSNGEADGLVGSERVTVHRNVFLNWQGRDTETFVQVGLDGKPYHEARDVRIQNNLLVGNTSKGIGAAFGVRGARDVLFANNTITGDLPSSAYAFWVTITERNPRNQNVYFYNNLWSDPTGTMGEDAPGSAGKFSKGRPASTDNLVLDNNLYWDGGRPIPAGELGSPLTVDARAVVADPLLRTDQEAVVLPRWDGSAFLSGSTSIRQEFLRLVELYGRVPAESPVAGGADPSVAPADDILGRPRGTAPALGAYETHPTLAVGPCDLEAAADSGR